MRKLALFLMVGVLLIACGKKEVKVQSQDSKMTAEAFAVAETVRDAFVKKDASTLQAHSTAEGYRDITLNSKPYDRVELAFTPRWVEIENGKVTVNIAWKSTWISSGRTADERGMAVMIMEGRPLKISGIPRGNPFLHPER